MLSELIVFAAAALAAVTLGAMPNGNCVGGPCGPQHQKCGAPFENAPEFHVMDATCGENDPNGPFYDETHQMYHLFYQDHLAITPGHGPDWGHAVSKDLVHWARLPVAIWNDQPYDRAAIFTGSTTIVDGKPVIVYPGLCFSKEYPNCKTGTLLAIAEPADPSDPLYTNWTKPSYNPIVNNTQRDPSTAWKTKAGEWRLTSYDATVYGSMDFKTWYTIGKSQFPVGECPSFFPLPKLYPNTTANPGETLPSHVHKCSHGGKDWMQVGTYNEGDVNTTGTWTATPGFSFDEVKIDAGDFYASKDFYDPVKDRRINWGWAKVPPASTQSLARHITWHPQLKQLMHSPLDEQTQLRGDVLASVTKPLDLDNSIKYLGNWTNAAGNQSEILMTFARPSTSVTFGVDVMTAADPQGPRTRIYVQYNATGASGNGSAVVGISNGAISPAMLTQYMPHTDLTGGDFNVTNVNYTDPHTCQAVCLANPKCEAWTYVVRPPLHAACCQKGASGWSYNPNNPTCTSGVRNPQPAPGGASKTDVLRFLPDDDEIELRVFVDNTFIEAYWMDGRVAMTSKLLGSAPEAGVSVFGMNGTATVNSGNIWHVKPIWVSPDDVLRQ